MPRTQNVFWTLWIANMWIFFPKLLKKYYDFNTRHRYISIVHYFYLTSAVAMTTMCVCVHSDSSGLRVLRLLVLLFPSFRKDKSFFFPVGVWYSKWSSLCGFTWPACCSCLTRCSTCTLNGPSSLLSLKTSIWNRVTARSDVYDASYEPLILGKVTTVMDNSKE